MQKRFGALEHWEYDDRADQLSEMSSYGGYGVMGIDSPPIECLRFCLSQYERFGIIVPKEIIEVVEEGIMVVMRHIDYVDPYLLFAGLSDVDMTLDWADHAYEIIEDGKVVSEASPEYMETFSSVPGQAEETFNYILSRPGLDALPRGIGSDFKDSIEGHPGWSCGHEESSLDRISPFATEVLFDLCKDLNGKVDYGRISAYFELAAWAGFAWIVGPESRTYRMCNHDIFAVALQFGEALLVDGMILSPENYRKLHRPPKSCHRCGVAAWCVELSMSGTSTRHICESCLSEGMPKMGMATCGSKFCMLSECPHHPYHHLGSAGLHTTMRKHGQLGAMARGESVLRLKDNQASYGVKLLPPV